jgi:Disulfide bond isomerase protein N-terminus
MNIKKYCQSMGVTAMLAVLICPVAIAQTTAQTTTPVIAAPAAVNAQSSAQAEVKIPLEQLKKKLEASIGVGSSIDGVMATPYLGLYEVRMGADIFYTDAQGDYVILGEIVDTKNRVNITKERIKLQ